MLIEVKLPTQKVGCIFKFQKKKQLKNEKSSNEQVTTESEVDCYFSTLRVLLQLNEDLRVIRLSRNTTE